MRPGAGMERDSRTRRLTERRRGITNPEDTAVERRSQRSVPQGGRTADPNADRLAEELEEYAKQADPATADPKLVDRLYKLVRKLKPFDISCEECRDEQPTFFGLQNDLWRSVADGARILCLRCTDRRVTELRGYGLVRSDFKEMPINSWIGDAEWLFSRWDE